MAFVKSVGIASNKKKTPLKSKAREKKEFVSGPSGETITPKERETLLTPVSQKNVLAKNIPPGMTPETARAWEIPLANQSYLQSQLQAQQQQQLEAGMESAGLIAEPSPQIEDQGMSIAPQVAPEEPTFGEQLTEAGVLGVGPTGTRAEELAREELATFGEIPSFQEFRTELQQKGFLGEVAGSLIPRSVGELALDVAEMAAIGTAMKSVTPKNPDVSASVRNSVNRIFRNRKEFSSQVTNQARKVITGQGDAATQASAGQSPQTVLQFGGARGGKGAFQPKIIINQGTAQAAGKALGRGILGSTKGKAALGIGVGLFVLSQIGDIVGMVQNIRMSQTIGVNEAGDANLGLSVQSSNTKKAFDQALKNGDLQEAMILMANQEEIEELQLESAEAMKVNETLIDSVAGGFGLKQYMARAEKKREASQLAITQNGQAMRREIAELLKQDLSYIQKAI